MIGQPTHILNDKLPCIDSLFITSSKLLSDVGVEQTVYDKCHHNIYTDGLISTYSFLHLTIGKFGITEAMGMASLVTKQQKKKLKVSSTSYEIYLEILFLIRLSNSTISVPVG